jgi:hypothetical protein
MAEESHSTTRIDGGSATTLYTQRLLYVYREQLMESTMKWSRYPPTQVVVRVNPDEPSEIFCVEQLGWSWVVSLLSAFAPLPLVGISWVFGWSRTTELLVILVSLGGTAWLVPRIRPNDRADTLSVTLRPNIGLQPSATSRRVSRRG